MVLLGWDTIMLSVKDAQALCDGVYALDHRNLPSDAFRVFVELRDTLSKWRHPQW